MAKFVKKKTFDLNIFLSHMKYWRKTKTCSWTGNEASTCFRGQYAYADNQQSIFRIMIIEYWITIFQQSWLPATKHRRLWWRETCLPSRRRVLRGLRPDEGTGLWRRCSSLSVSCLEVSGEAVAVAATTDGVSEIKKTLLNINCLNHQSKDGLFQHSRAIRVYKQHYIQENHIESLILPCSILNWSHPVYQIQAKTVHQTRKVKISWQAIILSKRQKTEKAFATFTIIQNNSFFVTFYDANFIKILSDKSILPGNKTVRNLVTTDRSF